MGTELHCSTSIRIWIDPSSSRAGRGDDFFAGAGARLRSGFRALRVPGASKAHQHGGEHPSRTECRSTHRVATGPATARCLLSKVAEDGEHDSQSVDPCAFETPLAALPVRLPWRQPEQSKPTRLRRAIWFQISARDPTWFSCHRGKTRSRPAVTFATQMHSKHRRSPDRLSFRVLGLRAELAGHAGRKKNFLVETIQPSSVMFFAWSSPVFGVISQSKKARW
jgi:hypothetical protein